MQSLIPAGEGDKESLRDVHFKLSREEVATAMAARVESNTNEMQQ